MEGEGEESLVCTTTSYFIKLCFSLYLGGPFHRDFYKGENNLLELLSEENDHLPSQHKNTVYEHTISMESQLFIYLFYIDISCFMLMI